MVLYPNRPTQRHSHLIIGASRGIGLEFTRQLLLEHDQHVIATARNINAPELRALQAQSEEQKKGTLMIVECDVTDEESIQRMAEYVGSLVKGAHLRGRTIENVIVNAGILEYPNRVLGSSFQTFQKHLTTNATGPLMCASALLSLKNGPQYEDLDDAPPSSSAPSTQTPAEAVAPAEPLLIIKNLIFTSSDSGSMKNFRAFEDGFAAYAASKAALNMGLRHLAAELAYTKHADAPTILAVHPGEVNTDMAKAVELAWEVEGTISPSESVGKMLAMIAVHGRGGEKEGEKGVATYLTWEGEEYPW